MPYERPIEVASMKPLSLIRLRTLERLRWFAVIGQTSVCLFVTLVMGFEVPVIPLILAIGIAAAVNIVVAVTQDRTRILDPAELAAHLIFDAIQIGTVLAMTGGILNPFSVWMVLAPMLAAFALEGRLAGIVIGVVVVVLSAIALWHEPMPGGHAEVDPALQTFGIWAALILGVAFTAAYARQVALSQIKLTTALEATQAVLAREERLTAVGGLAAMAAHELGTPLATIQVVARDMERELTDEALREDAELLISQTQRCQRILSRLSELSMSGDARMTEFSLEDMMQEAAKPFLDQKGPEIEFTYSPESDRLPPERLRRYAANVYALRTLIENAVKYARSRVKVTAAWDAETISVIVDDDGPGFSQDLIKRLGEPFPRHESAKLPGRGGLGLGFFIAKTLLERSGAVLNFGNRRELGGAWVAVSWPIAKLSMNEIEGEPFKEEMLV